MQQNNSHQVSITGIDLPMFVAIELVFKLVVAFMIVSALIAAIGIAGLGLITAML